MSKRKFDCTLYSRYKVLSLAMTVVMEDAIDDCLIIGGIKRPRYHAFWMSPYLYARTDPTQRNTFCKLEADFLRVS